MKVRGTAIHEDGMLPITCGHAAALLDDQPAERFGPLVVIEGAPPR